MQADESRAIRRGLRGARAIALLGFLAVAAAVFIDVAGAAGLQPPGWPMASHALIAAGIGAGLLATLVRLLVLGRRAPRPGATLLELVAFGLLLGAWRLRGHPEIPPDVPLVAATVLALVLLAAASAWRGWPARAG